MPGGGSGRQSGRRDAVARRQKRGHQVTLYEETGGELGGLLKISDGDETKIDMRNYKKSSHCTGNEIRPDRSEAAYESYSGNDKRKAARTD